MSPDTFRVLKVDLGTGKGELLEVGGRDQVAGGSGLAALLFSQFGRLGEPWDHPQQPLVFAIGPLTGYFPLMSKTVFAFRSPYHDQYAESHAGGRSALCLRFAGLDALVLVGRAAAPSCLTVGSRQLDLRETSYLWGMDVHQSGKVLRRMLRGAGHRSLLRIGPAGERGCAMACVNVDTYRHFGRLGGGAALGAKNLKALCVVGDAALPLPEGRDYAELFARVHRQVTGTDMMAKYHNLGTPANVSVLDGLKALPCRNLRQTSDPAVAGITGERFAADFLLRNAACSGCPVGCIHLGLLREKFQADNRYLYRQVAYDFEPIFAVGSMLGVFDGHAVLMLLDTVEQLGLDVMSAGVALAWATEAREKGLVGDAETGVPLRFGDAAPYREALARLALGANDFYRLLSSGVLRAAARYGGEEFACVLGQETAGYATGEVSFVSQALGLRHSHLDAAGYSYDEKGAGSDVGAAVEFLSADERSRALLTSMVGCLFARSVYGDDLLAECLRVIGFETLAGRLPEAAAEIQRRRWAVRLATGYDPKTTRIPGRFTEVSNWKGAVDPAFLSALQQAYAVRIEALAAAPAS
ncbi:MAG: aldehyde ferredoxin oxidoreductase [Deltaproteobacteria bacterium]|nr:aldehyde ferredoxin oxidoreductase [Deltaproteobacteria bacterium]